jgi:hypothetical protein
MVSKPTGEEVSRCEYRKEAQIAGIEPVCLDCVGCSVMILSVWEILERTWDNVSIDSSDPIAEWVTGCPPHPTQDTYALVKKIYDIHKNIGL